MVANEHNSLVLYALCTLSLYSGLSTVYLFPKLDFTYTYIESGVVLVHLIFSLLTDCEDFRLFLIDIKG